MARLGSLEKAVLADLAPHELDLLRLIVGSRLDAPAPAEQWRGHSFGALLAECGGARRVLVTALIEILRARRRPHPL
jgi:hypothetical protein